jgi:hypothetical protein
MVIDMVAAWRTEMDGIGKEKETGVRSDEICLEAGKHRLNELDWRKTLRS